MTRLRGSFAFAVAAALSLHAVPAAAHPLIEEARAQLDAPDFEAALQTLSRVESVTDFSLADLAEYLLLRAMVLSALPGRGLEVEAELTQLAMIAPDVRLDESVPPSVRESFVRVRGAVAALSLHVDAGRIPGGVRVVATPSDRRPVRAVRIHARAGQAEPVVHEGEALTLPAGAAARVEVWVEAVGLGGAVVVRRGSSEAPIVVEATDPLARDDRTRMDVPAETHDAADDRGGRWWIGIAVAGLAAAVGTTVALVLVTQDGGPRDTRLDGPHFPGWPAR